MNRRILLIEPDNVLANIYKQLFNQNGIVIDHVFTAQEAITKADINTPDLVICELQLVDHSGIEFLYEFRSYLDWRKIPIIINSIVPPREFGNSQLGLRKELGVCSYLYKPNTDLRQLSAYAENYLI